jgi:adenylate kinase
MANIVMLGPPGSGKGTQAERISEKYGWPQISTGNILRHAIETGSELGKKAKEFMDAGELLPDEIVDSIVEERLSHDDCKDGFILDGFPRDIEQAKDLQNFISLDVVFDVNVEDDLIIDRLGMRRVCDCGETYHLKFNPPKKEGICDRCGDGIYQRQDDNEKTIRHRLSVYHEKTEPLIEFYKSLDLLVVLEGSKDIDDVFHDIVSKIVYA